MELRKTILRTAKICGFSRVSRDAIAAQIAQCGRSHTSNLQRGSRARQTMDKCANFSRAKYISAAWIMSALLVALSGCQKQEGSAERAGKQVDKTMEKAGRQIEKAGQSIQNTAKGDKKQSSFIRSWIRL